MESTQILWLTLIHGEKNLPLDRLVYRGDFDDITKLNLALEHISKQQGVILLSNILPDVGRICSHRDMEEFSIEIDLAYQIVEKWARKKFLSREVSGGC